MASLHLVRIWKFLTMTFMDDSWIEVRDADMQLIMWDLMRSGAALEIKGKTPFEVLLGNSPDVVIHIDGERFDHSRFTRVTVRPGSRYRAIC